MQFCESSILVSDSYGLDVIISDIKAIALTLT